MDSAMVNDDQFQLLTCIDISTVLTEFIDVHDFKYHSIVRFDDTILFI